MVVKTVRGITGYGEKNKRKVMTRGIITGIAIIIVGIIIIIISQDSSETSNNEIFHVTLADPKMYVNNMFVSDVTFGVGKYAFEFVPSGSSPEQITIHLDGEQSIRHEFELKGTLQDTGISEYYTWEYLGDDSFEISNPQEMTITIDPHGDISGSVSIYIIQERGVTPITAER